MRPASSAWGRAPRPLQQDDALLDPTELSELLRRLKRARAVRVVLAHELVVGDRLVALSERVVRLALLVVGVRNRVRIGRLEFLNDLIVGGDRFLVLAAQIVRLAGEKQCARQIGTRRTLL